MKRKITKECPCGDYEFSLTFIAEKDIELFCPFCSVPLEEEEELTEEDED